MQFTALQAFWPGMLLKDALFCSPEMVPERLPHVDSRPSQRASEQKPASVLQKSGSAFGWYELLEISTHALTTTCTTSFWNVGLRAPVTADAVCLSRVLALLKSALQGCRCWRETCSKRSTPSKPS